MVLILKLAKEKLRIPGNYFGDNMSIRIQKIINGTWSDLAEIENYKIKNGTIFIANDIEVGVKDNLRVVDDEETPQVLQIKFTKDEVI